MKKFESPTIEIDSFSLVDTITVSENLYGGGTEGGDDTPISTFPPVEFERIGNFYTSK